jgi:putative CocE/NonD family hydrolase
MMRARPIPGYDSLTIERDVPARMRDGTALFADVYRPSAPGRYPVILFRHPYDKAPVASLTYAHAAWYARHGYIVVNQDVRGRYTSQGEWYPFLHEADDGEDTVEWAASLPGSNGRVGMMGFSYYGATQLQAALRRPPSLRCICPGMTGSQYYEGWTYTQGAFALAFIASWATFLAIGEAKRRGDDAAALAMLEAFLSGNQLYGYLPLEDYPPLGGNDLAPYFRDWLAHSTYDEYWRRWSIDTDYSRIDVPALHLAGWYDVFLSGTVDNFVGLRDGAGSEAARARQKLLVGPWYHIPWTPMVGQVWLGAQASNQVVNEWQIRWFDQFLKDEDTGVLDAPVTLFVMGDNVWRDESHWPPRGARFVAYYLHSGGRANSALGDGTLSPEPPGNEPPDLYSYDPIFPVPSQGGHSCCFPNVAPMGAVDQGLPEALNAVLVYTSAPLERDLEVTGPVSATLYAASSAVDTDFVVRLCDVYPDGRSINIQEGIVRARYRDSLTDPAPITPDEVYEYRIRLGPTSNVFKAGHRIRVDVTSSDFPQWDRNLNTGGPLGKEGLAHAVVANQVLLHTSQYPSRIILPVVEH